MDGRLENPARTSSSLLRVPLVLIVAHAVLMVFLANELYESGEAMQSGKSPTGNEAWSLVQRLDFPVHRVAEKLTIQVFGSTRPSLHRAMDWMELRTLTDLILAVYWRALLILGSLQWFMAGLSIEGLISLRRKLSQRHLNPVGQ